MVAIVPTRCLQQLVPPLSRAVGSLACVGVLCLIVVAGHHVTKFLWARRGFKCCRCCCRCHDRFLQDAPQVVALEPPPQASRRLLAAVIKRVATSTTRSISTSSSLFFRKGVGMRSFHLKTIRNFTPTINRTRLMSFLLEATRHQYKDSKKKALTIDDIKSTFTTGNNHSTSNHANKSWHSHIPIILPGWAHHTGGSRSIPTVHPCPLRRRGCG